MTTPETEPKEEIEDAAGRDIVAYDPSAHAVSMDRVRGAPLLTFDAEQREIIRGQIAPDATDLELAFVISYAKRVGLDPIAKQIYAIPREVNRKVTDINGAQQWVKERRLTIQTSIDGLRLIAQRTGDYAGRRGPFWCGPDGKWTDVWLRNEPPAAARVGVLRHGFVEPLYAVAHWREYVPQSGQDKMWQKMPAGQLAKCSEALALRSAFPAELSGLYSDDEMAQADMVERRDTDPTGGTTANAMVTQQKARTFGYPENVPEAIRLFESVGVPFLMDWLQEALLVQFKEQHESWGKLPDAQKKWAWDGVKKAIDWLEQHEQEFETPIGPSLALEQARAMFASAFGGLALEGPVAKMEEQLQQTQEWVFRRQVERGLRNEDGSFTEQGQAEYGVDASGSLVEIEDGEILDADGNPIPFGDDLGYGS